MTYNLVPVIDIFELEAALEENYNLDFERFPLADLLFGNDWNQNTYLRFDISPSVHYNIEILRQTQTHLAHYFAPHDFVLIHCYW